MLRRVAEGQRSSPGEVVITKAFLIETQSVFSDNSSPIAGMIVQVQIDPNKLGIKLAGVEASSLKDCNESHGPSKNMNLVESVFSSRCSSRVTLCPFRLLESRWMAVVMLESRWMAVVMLESRWMVVVMLESGKR
ncbi:unnamed protein product [Peronospora belbahrii]|uniref:Uncharacterized protein n=1 Tax=Peronospora belbahrii TaxID=622444 RepID=A0AAU9KMK4_9STRA|nr:unnamed protein product [Peronospora belbahrii]